MEKGQKGGKRRWNMFENLMALKIDILGLTLTFYLFFLAQLNTY